MTIAARPRGRKQSMTHAEFVAIRDAATLIVPRPVYTALLADTLAEIARVTAGRRVGYAWSGGKDSQALEVVMTAAGFTDCCFGMTNLEYQAFLVWVTDHMPAGLQVYNNGWDVNWLARHEPWMFPTTAAIAGHWFSGVQHRAQRLFIGDRGLDLLITGRRRADGNYTPGEDGVYRGPDGALRYAPLRAWSHADVFACLEYAGVTAAAPFYRWPRGYRVGTHSWPARQWCRDAAQGFAEVWSIEPDRVREAAAGGVLGAARWMLEQGHR